MNQKVVIEKVEPMREVYGKEQSEKWVRGGIVNSSMYNEFWRFYCENNATSRVTGSDGSVYENNGERRVFSKSHIIIAKNGEQIVGVGWVHQPVNVPQPEGQTFVPGKKYLEQLFHVSVAKEAENNGVGTSIVKNIESIVDSEAIPVCTWNDNYERPAKFFQKLGFEVYHNRARKNKV